MRLPSYCFIPVESCFPMRKQFSCYFTHSFGRQMLLHSFQDHFTYCIHCTILHTYDYIVYTESWTTCGPPEDYLRIIPRLSVLKASEAIQDPDEG